MVAQVQEWAILRSVRCAMPEQEVSKMVGVALGSRAGEEDAEETQENWKMSRMHEMTTDAGRHAVCHDAFAPVSCALLC